MALFCESLPSVCIYAFCMAESCPRRPQQQKTRRNVFVSWSFFAAVATQKNCGFPLRHTRLIYRFLCGVGRRTVFVGLTLKIDNRTARELVTHWVQPLPKAAHLDHKINLSIINTVIVINSPKTIPNSTICALHICVLNIRFSSLPKFWPNPAKVFLHFYTLLTYVIVRWEYVALQSTLCTNRCCNPLLPIMVWNQLESGVVIIRCNACLLVTFARTGFALIFPWWKEQWERRDRRWSQTLFLP